MEKDNYGKRSKAQAHVMTLVPRTVKEKLHDAGEAVREFVDHAGHQITEAKEKTQTTIKEHPLTSTAIAFGLGVLLTRLLRR